MKAPKHCYNRRVDENYEAPPQAAHHDIEPICVPGKAESQAVARRHVILYFWLSQGSEKFPWTVA